MIAILHTFFNCCVTTAVFVLYVELFDKGLCDPPDCS